jgi:hypothetical protein
MIEAHDWIGVPVCAVLKDGIYRYGIIREIQGDQIVMQGFKGKKKLSDCSARRFANMLGMLGGLGDIAGAILRINGLPKYY